MNFMNELESVKNVFLRKRYNLIMNFLGNSFNYICTRETTKNIGNQWRKISKSVTVENIEK